MGIENDTEKDQKLYEAIQAFYEAEMERKQLIAERFPNDVPNPIFVDTVSLYDGDFMYHVFMGEVNSNWNVPTGPEPEDPIFLGVDPKDPIVPDTEPELEMQESDN